MSKSHVIFSHTCRINFLPSDLQDIAKHEPRPESAERPSGLCFVSFADLRQASAMFKSRKAQDAVASLDFSQGARDSSSYILGELRELGLGSELTAFAFDPVQSLLAVGTERGKLFVFGGPAVELSWSLGVPVKVKHLAFLAGRGFLCIVDAKDTLSVYDLGRFDTAGKPVRDSSQSMRSNITCIETSASHPFLFLGGKDGSVDVFDVDRGVMASHARIPNLWLAQEELLRRSGVLDAPSRRHIPLCIDVKLHPLDLNLILVAYEGGVSLWNLAEQHAVRNWEFVIPPGAPGGGNDNEEQLFTERRPNVTCVAWRPDGLVFAVGHEDGCLSFASVDDELPIEIRTIERAAVHKTTEEDLFGWSAQGQGGQRQVADREPIFKLAWSGYPEETMMERAAAAWNSTSPNPMSPTSPASPGLREIPGTTLTVLGGLLPRDPAGVHVFELPPYAAQHATTSKSGNLPVVVREALQTSVTPIAHHLYPTATPPEDFLLLPRASPYYGNNYDPEAIIVTTGTDPRQAVLAAAHASHGAEAWSFPPTISRAPASLRLPGTLSWAGGGACSAAQVLNMPTLSYRRMLHQFEMVDEMSDRLPLRGGKAFPKTRQWNSSLRPQDDNQYRILVTLHVDLTVRFWDVSSHLLKASKAHDADVSSPQLAQEYPRPLRHLDWNLKETLQDASARHLEASRLLQDRPWELELDKVSVAPESLEIAASLTTGEVIISRLAYGEARHPLAVEYERTHAENELNDTVQETLQGLSIDPSAPPEPHIPPQSFSATPPALEREPTLRKLSRGRKSSSSASMSHQHLSEQDYFVDLSAVIVQKPFHDGFRSFAAFTPPAGSKTCLSFSDIGFMAASSDSTLLIADMRGRDVMLVDSPSHPFTGGSGKGKSKSKARHDPSSITSLTWTISSTMDDHDHNPRLIVVQASGLVRVFELANVGGGWIISDGVLAFDHDSVAGACETFVIDKFGQELKADPTSLQRALQHQTSYSRESHEAKGSLTSLWITVTPSMVSVYFNIDGPKTAQYEERDGFQSAKIAWRFGCPVLLVSSKVRNIYALSLPDLSPITRMTFDAAVHTSAGTISFSSDGDLVQLIDPLTIRLHTTADLNRPSFPPRLEIWDPTIPIPWQTGLLGGVASVFSSLFGGQHVYTVAEMEHVLGGGTKRPPPKVRQRAIQVDQAIKPKSTTATKTRSSTAFPPARTKAQDVQADADSTVGIMAQTQAALAQRGEYLTSLQSKLGAVANDAAKFAKETKQAAQRDAVKGAVQSKFTSFFK